MPRRSAYRLPCSVERRRLSDGSMSFTASKSLGYTHDGKRRRIRGQAADLPGAVARLVVLLTAASETTAAEDLTAAAVGQFGEGFRTRVAAETPSAAPVLLDALTTHLTRRQRDGHLSSLSHSRAVGLVQNHVAPHAIATQRLDEITSAGLRGFFDDLAAKRKSPDDPASPPLLGPTPRRSIHGFLAQVFAAAEDEGIVARSPMRHIERPAKPSVKSSGIGKKRGAVERTMRLMQDVPYATYLMLLPLALGLRTSERLGLVHDSFHLTSDALEMTIDAQLGRDNDYPARVPVKTENARRTLPLPLDLLPHIDALYLKRITATGKARVEFTADMLADAIATRDAGGYLRNASGAVTGSPLIDPHLFLYVGRDGAPVRAQRASSVWNKIRRTWASDEPGWVEHDFRHVARTILERERFPDATIAAWLGHAHGGTMTGTYGHVGRDELRAAGHALWTRFRRWPEPVADAATVDDLAAGVFLAFRHEFWRPSTDLDTITDTFYAIAPDGTTPATLAASDADALLRRRHGVTLEEIAYREAWLPDGHRWTPPHHLAHVRP